MGSAIELSGTIIPPFGANRGRLERNAFENALFLWEAAQQHACTTYQALLQTPLMLPEVGRLKQAIAAWRGQSIHSASPYFRLMSSANRRARDPLDKSEVSQENDALDPLA